MKMVDYSKVHEVIAETNEGILLAEYQPEYRTDREFQSEADLERQLLTDLVNGLNYERLAIHTSAELLENAKIQIEKLNKINFTDAEWQRFVVEYLDCPNEGLVEKTRKIQGNHIYDFVFDDGRIKNIFILDKKNIHNNSMQVINQVTQVGSHTNRYDVTILVNGLPLVQIELKTLQITPKKAMEQILADIQSGKFADEFLADSKNGQKFLKEHREAAANHPIEPVGAELRHLMSWLK